MSYSINKKINWLEKSKFESHLKHEDEEDDFFTQGVNRDNDYDEEDEQSDLLSEKELQKLEQLELENEDLFDDENDDY